MSLCRARARWALAFCFAFAAIRASDAQDTVVSKALPPVETHGFIQVYYRDNDPVTKDGFRLRKADLKFNGFISPRLAWRISFDAGKALALNTTQTQISDTATLTGASVDQRSRMLQDAALTMRVNDYLALDIGQQIVPLSLEGTISSSKVETIERTLFIAERSRAVGLGDVRDIGVSANGLVFEGLEYHVGVFNEAGDGAGSTTDANDQKTVMARVTYHVPAVPGLQLGGSGGYQPGPGTVYRQRAGSEVEFVRPWYTLRTETMAARDGALRRFGWYGLGVLRPIPGVQLSARYDYWDRDIGAENVLSNALQKEITGGASYAFDATAKVAFNLVHQTFPNVPSIPKRVFGLLAFQAVW